jgi:hypothetical protein
MSDTPTAAGAPRPRTLAECRAELAHKRDLLIANIKAAEAGPRGGGRSRGVQLDTPQKGAAWLSWGNGGRIDADYALPQLRPLFMELRIQHKLDVPAWQGEPQTDAAALQMLDDYLAACDRTIGHARGAAPSPTANPPPVSEQPRLLLTDWRGIAAALDMKYADRDKIKSLNARLKGPIVNSGPGTSPLVYRDELIQWWNRLAIQAEELANQREGKRLTAEAQHNYGKDGTAAPEINGEVKKRRRDRKPT